MASTEPERVMEEAPPQMPVTDHQRELATQAMNEFDRGHWNQCTTTMARLADARPTDVKVVLNRSVALFYQSGCKAIDELKHNILTVFNMAQISPDLTESNNLDDADYAVVYYNKAVVLFHEKQYRASLSILEKLFRYIEPIDEALAQKVMLLLTELYLTVHQPYDAMRMVLNIEKGLSGKSQEKDKSDGNMTLEQLKTKLTLLKIRCNLMAKLAKNKKECKSLPGNNVSVNYVKSYYEFLRGNLKKAAKFLGNPPSNIQLSHTTGECLSVMYNNNQAIINMSLGKPNSAICQIRDALQSNEKVAREAVPNDKAKPPLQVSYVGQHYILFYNLGILQLHSQRPSQAFECFVECIQVYQKNPRLWLRLAECCIMHLREDNEVDRQHKQKCQVIQSSVGSGFHHKLIFGQGVTMETGERKTPERGVPSLSLSFARYCLKNAMVLLPLDPLDVKQPVPDDQVDTVPPPADPVLVSAEPGNPLREGEVANLRCSILAASAYIALCEDEYYLALSYSNNLLRQPNLSAAQKYLGHMYKGEALVALDRIADAVDELNSEEVTDVSTALPEVPVEIEKDQDPILQNRGSSIQWIPSNPVVAKGLMQYNLAVTYAMRTEYDRAQKALSESSEKVGSPLPVQMFYLKIYLDLKQGNRKGVFDVINEHFSCMARK